MVLGVCLIMPHGRYCLINCCVLHSLDRPGLHEWCSGLHEYVRPGGLCSLSSLLGGAPPPPTSPDTHMVSLNWMCLWMLCMFCFLSVVDGVHYT